MLEQKIYQDYVQAMKAKDQRRAQFLSFVRAELKNAAIRENKNALNDEQVIAVLRKEIKRLEESRQLAGQAAKADLVEKAEQELVIAREYLPAALSAEELEEIIRAAIVRTGASSMRDMGTVMKEVMAHTGSRAAANEVSAIVKQRLA